ncbi:hydrogenase maturation protease [Desulfofustis glycolicus]|uniref:Coenzyme F420 hydrogenase subunit delta n=1 Tax=Desulfofustis glycolicus DSM 9705 TaxID=1121409 RepID=A0A1M5SCP1_9BACT|nr:hydrogenase maturation protease [Desulfofustis glycolicus]MCB2216150.1 hydrogenase maturation protease [Desulfobulbaceae bacterium]SHH36347.1 coenzyme F420 hydrogenase subunit delta [Desulfofustis glycolicus DSM 9705]
MSSTMIFGCGNLLMGDDGFGPAVVAALNDGGDLPDNVEAVDAMTGIREYLFDYLLTEEGRPEHIIILDAVDFPDRQPGDVFLIDSRSIPAKKIHDFSLHQFPTVNLLHELEEHTGITVTIVAAQAEYIPAEIEPGLSPTMTGAVVKTCEMLKRILLNQLNEVTLDDV